jgi:predicted nucleotidyltransferase
MDGSGKAACVVPEKINEMVRRIVERFHPDRIILFGSHARGTAGPDSDADLLVIMPVTGSRRKQATAIDLALLGVDLPADVLVVSPEEVERNRDRLGTIIGPALREGKVLYERDA